MCTMKTVFVPGIHNIPLRTYLVPGPWCSLSRKGAKPFLIHIAHRMYRRDAMQGTSSKTARYIAWKSEKLPPIVRKVFWYHRQVGACARAWLERRCSWPVGKVCQGGQRDAFKPTKKKGATYTPRINNVIVKINVFNNNKQQEERVK